MVVLEAGSVLLLRKHGQKNNIISIQCNEPGAERFGAEGLMPEEEGEEEGEDGGQQASR